MKLALLIVDMQKLYLQDRVSPQIVDSACEYINYVSGKLRDKGHLVVHIQHLEDGHTQEDEVLQVIPQIVSGPEDKRVWKQFNSGFWQTELEGLLREEQVDFVVVSGFSAEYCVTFTYNGSMERGFKTAILQRGIASQNPDAILNVYRDRNLISYPVIEAMIG